jgi:hypothetical protein
MESAKKPAMAAMKIKSVMLLPRIAQARSLRHDEKIVVGA